MVQAAAEVLPLDRVEAGHMLLQAELEARAVGAHPADARLDYWGADIGKAQAGNRINTHLGLCYASFERPSGGMPLTNEGRQRDTRGRN